MYKADHCIACGYGAPWHYAAGVNPFITHYVFDGKEPSSELLYCPRCHFQFFAIRYDEADMARLYTGYRGEHYNTVREQYEPGYAARAAVIGKYPDEMQQRKGFIELLMRRVPLDNVRSVLDYGGDKGQFIPPIFDHAKKYVYEVSGVEPVAGVSTVARADAHAPYDVVLCCHVLEHVADPRKTLEELKSLCAPGGYIYIEVPSELTLLWCIAVLFAHPLIRKVSPGRMHEHINFFSRPSLRSTVLSVGLTPMGTELKFFRTKWYQSYAIGMVCRNSPPEAYTPKRRLWPILRELLTMKMRWW